jgi:tRNA pseudouridine55 synthase
MSKYQSRNLDGILLLDKPTGISSNGALQMAKRLFRAKKAGHSGSLDPIASGLLPIFFGESTKFSQFLLEADKHYQVTAQLGIKTNTGDTEGHVIATRPVRPFTEAEIEAALVPFRGLIAQIPPMFSALKHKGQPLYKLARQGIEIERVSREIRVYDLNIRAYEGDKLSLYIKATKGTYVRTLVEDIGEALGCGAHVVTLRRVGAGPYTEAQMIPMSVLETLSEQEDWAQLDACLLPLDSSVSTWPELMLSEAAAFYLMQGQPVLVPYAPRTGWVRLLLKNNKFVGVGEILEDGRVAPRRLLKHH